MSTQSYKCSGENCPLKRDCYRYTRRPDKDQKYYKNIPYQENGGRCDFYLPSWVLDELKTEKDDSDNSNTGKTRGKAG